MSTENKINWKNELDKFNLLYTKILYMIYYFFNIKHFNDKQNKKLKELVILENSDIINSFKKFEKNNNLDDFEKDLKNIYEKNVLKSFIHNAYISTLKYDNENEEEVDVNEIESLNSPMGRDMKMLKRNEKKK
jgi:hypothetical protein